MHLKPKALGIAAYLFPVMLILIGVPAILLQQLLLPGDLDAVWYIITRFAWFQVPLFFALSAGVVLAAILFAGYASYQIASAHLRGQALGLGANPVVGSITFIYAVPVIAAVVGGAAYLVSPIMAAILGLIAGVVGFFLAGPTIGLTIASMLNARVHYRRLIDNIEANGMSPDIILRDGHMDGVAAVDTNAGKIALPNRVYQTGDLDSIHSVSKGNKTSLQLSFKQGQNLHSIGYFNSEKAQQDYQRLGAALNLG